MSDKATIKMAALTLDSTHALELGQFYATLLGWEIPFHDAEYVVVSPPGAHRGAYPYITIQQNPDYVPPVWPDKPGAQQQMAHIDFAVDDLEKAVAYAVQCGAAVAGEQFTSGWTVMIDPAGHPFCLCLQKELFQSEHFALL